MNPIPINASSSKDGGKERRTTVTSIPEFALPPVIVAFCRSSDTIPFVTNEEYFDAVLACETCRFFSHKLRYDLARHLFNVSEEDLAFFEGERVKNGTELSSILDELLSKLDSKRKVRVEHTKTEGKINLIIETFLRNMNATEWEGAIFRAFLCASTCLLVGYPGDDYYVRIDTLYWVKHLFPSGYSTYTIMKLLDMDSKWVKEHIYQHLPTIAEKSSLLSKMSDSMVSIFMGAMQISVSQYQELDSVVLQETLLQSEEFQKTKTGKAILERKNMDDKMNSSNEGGADVPTESHTNTAPLLQAIQKLDSTSKKSSKIQSDRIYNILADAARKETTVDDVVITDSDGADGRRRGGENDDGDLNVDTTEDNEDSGALIEKEDVAVDDDIIANDVDTEITSPSNDAVIDSTSDDVDNEFGPYKNNLQYLEDQIELLNKTILVNKDKSKLAMNAFDNVNGDYYNDEYIKISKEQHERLIKGKIEKNEKKVVKLKERIKLKLAVTKIMPRLEQLVLALSLDEFEKLVLLNLIRWILMPNHCHTGDVAVGTCIGDAIEGFASTLEEKMVARKYFYKTARLVQEGILYVSQNDFMQDLTNCSIDLDRRMFDFLVGLDTEFSEVVDGSHLYMPNVQFDDAVLPQATKQKILDRVEKFEEVKQTYIDLQLDEKITYGTGQVLLFYGASGTGKTMMANAIATKLQKKVLLVNFPSLGSNSSGRLIKFLFREARIQKALLFFDECESLFHSREVGSCEGSINMILTELERFNGLCILATNRPMDLDEAMHRRITLAVEFLKPDRFAREQIWKNLHPPKLQLDPDVNLCELARKFELTGGHIKNAWLSAIGSMVQRGGSIVTQQDLVSSCSDQVIGRLSLEEFDQRIVPTCGIESMVVSSTVKENLESIVQYTQAQTVLFGSWGFSSVHRASTGVTALFCGPPGTGKTMAAEAISFDLGKPLMVINIAELISKWVGETGKNISAVFDGAKSKDVVLVFDEAEGLFGERGNNNSSGGGSGGDAVNRHDTMNVALLLQYIEKFSGVCIVITNKHYMIDEAFFRRFNYVVRFETPCEELRLQLWKSIIPKECPLNQDIDLPYLAQRYKFCGGDIKSALFNAATKAALRNNPTERKLSQLDLEKACDEEERKMFGGISSSSEYYSPTPTFGVGVGLVNRPPFDNE